MCLVCLSQSWVTDVPALISTHEFFHLLLLLSKSEKATGGLGPLPQGGLSCAISGCRVLLGLLFRRSVLMKHLCDQGKEVRTLWSYTEDGKEADWMFSWIQGSLNLQLKETQAVSAYWIGKQRMGPFLCARSQAEVSWMIKGSLAKLKYKKPSSHKWWNAALRNPQSP